MKISANKEELVKAIQIVQNAVTTRGSLPILSNILIEAKNTQVAFTATDLDIAITCVLSADVEETGAITVPAKRFSDIIKELWADENIKINAPKGNQIRIEAKKTYFKLPAVPKDDFPQIPPFIADKNTLSLPQPQLKEMIRLTQFAMSRDEARYVLNGTLFDFTRRQFRLVATDGRRLAMIERDMGEVPAVKRKVIVPTKTIHELSRNLQDEGTVEIIFKDNQIQFKINQVYITSRLIDGEFPNYEQVIPQKTKEQVTISTQELLAATRRASIFTSQESQSIRISLEKGKMVITKNTPDVGEAYEELELEYQGGTIVIGFNPTYLIDVLKNVQEEKIAFELIDPEKPGVIRTGPQYTYIVLPMQLN